MIRLVLALALLVPVALAQRAPRTPDVAAERYHAGAQAFIAGNVAEARAAVDAGLQAAPDNERLQALRDLIEQEQQDDQDGGQSEDASEGEEGQEGNPRQNGQNPNQPPPPEGPEAEQDQTRTQPQEQDGQSEAGRQGGQGGDTDAEAAEPQGQMTRAQAERILEAVGGEEQLLLRELRRAPTRGRRTDKDW